MDLFGVTVAGLVIIGAMQWRVQRTGGSPLIVAAVAMAVVSLISPLGWGHSYAYVLPLFVMVASQAFAARHLAWLAAIGAAYVAILIPAHHQFSIAQASPALWHLLYSRYALATLVLLAAGWRFTGVREIACGDR